MGRVGKSHQPETFKVPSADCLLTLLPTAQQEWRPQGQARSSRALSWWTSTVVPWLRRLLGLGALLLLGGSPGIVGGLSTLQPGGGGVGD